MRVTRQDERSWTESGVPGIQTCPTWSGSEGDGGYLARFRAGARFPRHSHHGWEQVVVLEGRIRFNADDLGAGDIMQVQGHDTHEALALTDALLFVAHRGGIEPEA